jgi:sugar phosphate isomerase/epimerase
MAPIFAALKSIGYSGFVSAEVFPKPDADAAMMATLKTWFELA